jgi:hypothetical protein
MYVQYLGRQTKLSVYHKKRDQLAKASVKTAAGHQVDISPSTFSDNINLLGIGFCNAHGVRGMA